MDKPPNVNEYPAFRIIYFTFLSALRIVFFFLCVSTYTYWIHKKLGRKIRIAIPSCVVKKKKKLEKASQVKVENIYAH